ncbi:putative HTH domain, homologous to N-terminal domain of RPA1 protein family [Halapricum desulfuricans]|uniref:Putative HTH domain, homologous to N-terminal domain of RPA1 protein family n=1 Tax=Halapricum desulfuricans TaxID=2841257 RepID=A0A897NDK8_9EURY|nr:DUF2240 family protein [Halapricum desulfuricans]QSG10752.1 putative HTH domain, homologous to N-terminal domain of RPA1 protein family [Halapricum desulfuricans]
MSLRTAVGAPFVQAGTDRLGRSDFVVALSLDRDWFSPDQAKRLIDVAASEGLLEPDDDELVATFDLGEVTVPEGFTPDESVLQQRTTFERLLDAVVEAGTDKREAVAAINGLQSDLGVTIETAAVVYARRRGVSVDDQIERVREGL